MRSRRSPRSTFRRRGGFGTATLTADEHGVAGARLCRVVSSHCRPPSTMRSRPRAPTSAMDARCTMVTERPHARRCSWRTAMPSTARLAVVADGTGAAVAGVARKRRDYGQVALVAKLDHRDAARRRRVRALHDQRSDGAAAGRRSLRPRLDDDAAGGRERALALPDEQFLAELARHFGARSERLHAVARAQDVSARARIRAACRDGARACSSATRRRRCIRSPDRGSISACAMHSSSRRAINAAPRALGEPRDASRATPRGAASTAMPASPSRTASRSIFALDDAICRAGRAGSRSRCSMRCRRRSGPSRARCSSACPERAFACLTREIARRATLHRYERA